jgi:hypothetical protein
MKTKLSLYPKKKDVAQQAKFRLFVEGSGNVNFDAKILHELFEKNELPIKIESLGSCDNIQQTAKALIEHHPEYFFLIDRDWHNNQTVENAWNNFKTENKPNLLIWRQRELENYFLDADYLYQAIQNQQIVLKEEYSSPNQLKQAIIKEAQKHVFIDAANAVLAFFKTNIRNNSFQNNFSDLGAFKSSQDALQQLHQIKLLEPIKNKLAELNTPNLIQEKYEKILTELTGNVQNTSPTLIWDQGTWRQQLDGKQILAAIIDRCFEFVDTEQNTITGDQKKIAITKYLVQLDITQQPKDFEILITTLKDKIQGWKS